ncbi:MAG: pirin family protein [Candidatus Sericytochromatia bacterium]
MRDTLPRLLTGQSKDLGEGVHILRYLPHHAPQAVGPFVFFDYMPRLQFAAGTGSDVRPHPHIGLSTLSYLFDGRMHHRDSLGSDLILAPGDVLLMTSGRGIVHSERTPQADRAQSSSLHMVQFWLALPQAEEECEPAIGYATTAELPQWEIQAGLQARLAIGQWQEQQAPVSSHLAPLLLDLQASRAGSWQFENDTRELAVFVLSGELRSGEQAWPSASCVLLPSEALIQLNYTADSHFLIFGGQPLDGHRHIWWNLVSSDRERIEAAKQRWQKGEFPSVPGDDAEFIPLPA